MSKFELKSIPKLQKMLDIYYIIMYNIFTMKNCHQKYDKTIRRFAKNRRIYRVMHIFTKGVMPYVQEHIFPLFGAGS